jgi:hypothetical protein
MQRFELPCLLGLALFGVTNSFAKEPNVLFGPGTLLCKVFASADLNTNFRNPVRKETFTWTQGWFSARNYVGRESKPLTVGGSLSAATLELFLVDECRDHPNIQVWEAAQLLYDRLAERAL